MIRVLSSYDYTAMPWKNGRGTSLQIAAFPNDADAESCDWRVALATMDTPCEFSLYPGVDRSLSLISGGALRLTSKCDEYSYSNEIKLTQGAVFSWPGEQQIDATADGNGLFSICDFNIMTRRSNCSHTLAFCNIQDEQIVCRGQIVVVFCVDGTVDVVESEQVRQLLPRDSLLVQAESTETLAVRIRGHSAKYLLATIQKSVSK